MPIMIRVEVPGMTVQQYEQMSVTMLEQIRRQKGFIAHAGMAIPGGIQVVEMWDSQETFDAWIKNVVMPAAQQAGVAPPILQFYPAQRVVTR